MSFFSTIKSAHAQDYFFDEEFNQERAINTLDNNKWTYFPNVSAPNIRSIVETGGNLTTLQDAQTHQYPLIISKNGLPDGDFSAEIKFQYTKVTFWGTGIALADQAPVNGKDDTPILKLDVWQDKSVGPNMRVEFNGVMVKTYNINTDPHIFKVNRAGKKYLVYLDNQLVYTTPDILTQTKYIWMGNPTFQDPPIPEWTRFNVDYVRVSSTPTPTSQAPQPFLDLPWDYQGKGLTFNEAALSINSYFDHEYPLLSSGLAEPNSALNTLVKYEGPTRTNDFYSSHDGYDYGRRARVNIGDPVLAAAAGVATYINNCFACGNMIVIDHQNSYQTRYLHLQKDGLITNLPGQKVSVTAHQPIGKVGATGNVSPAGDAGAHIHFGVFQDKNSDRNFEDNIPDGVTDPFGWQSTAADPWENYSFFQNGQKKAGNKSFYLWINKLDNLDATLNSNGGVFSSGRYTVNFPTGFTNQNLNLNIKPAATVSPNQSLTSLGTTLIINTTDALGNLVSQFQALYTIKTDFSLFDLNKFQKNTISFYSSQDGLNWKKEPTTIDWASKTATTQVNHMTQFALMAERADTIAPTTTANLVGDQGQPNWFRSDVTLNLAAKDNDGGLGVDYTMYKINDGDWEIYTTPLKFGNEGHYKVQFYSADKDENLEAVKSAEFDIDKTIPEAKISVDQNLADIVVAGIDTNKTTTTKSANQKTKRPDDYFYTISDSAGNQLILDVRDWDHQKKEIFKIYSLSYNSDSQKQPENHYRVRYQGDKDNLKIAQESFEIKGEVKIRIKYNPDKNQSTIFTKPDGQEKTKEIRSGLVILQLITNQGKLDYSY